MCYVCLYKCHTNLLHLKPYTVYNHYLNCHKLLISANRKQNLTTSVSNVVFNPINMATSTDYSTIYTVLLRLKECMNVLGQQYAPVIFDMSMLAKGKKH